ncbi:FANCM protein, partial [Vireo altiloquus]|nr:FANCM protein [Vireo altiloquus]
MRGVYLSSVRSPALGSRYKMVHREFDPAAVFSQIPEQDPAYAEDSFCVGDEEEEAQSSCSEEEVAVNFDLLTTESSGGGRSRYLTRRRARLRQARLAQRAPALPHRRKPSRIIVLGDSSEEETAASREEPVGAACSGAGQGEGQLPRALPSAPSAQLRSGAGGEGTEGLLGSGAAGILDVPPEQPGPVPTAGSGCRNTESPSLAGISRGPVEQSPSLAGIRGSMEQNPSLAGNSRGSMEQRPSLCVLADTREICSGPEVISCLRAQHRLRVQVCALGTTDYMVSNRLAVERLLQSELQSPGNRNKLSQRLQRLQGSFERICVIVEADRVRPGETSRFFQRTQYYDGVLSALVQAGIRILFSSCQEETAALLKELALLEHRKGAAIQVPTEPEGHRRDILNFYLSIPNLSYGAALNLCHSFGSVAAVANSSVPALAAGSRLSLPRAEQLHRFLRHDFDLQLLPQPLPAKGKS